MNAIYHTQVRLQYAMRCKMVRALQMFVVVREAFAEC